MAASLEPKMVKHSCNGQAEKGPNKKKIVSHSACPTKREQDESRWFRCREHTMKILTITYDKANLAGSLRK